MFKRIFDPVFNKVFRKTVDSDREFVNLETEDGFNLLQENGSLIGI